jgi:hypothetical protein
MSITSYPALVTLNEPVSIGGTSADAFGRTRVSAPITLFDSQNRYAKSSDFDESLSGSATCTHAVKLEKPKECLLTSQGSLCW